MSSPQITASSGDIIHQRTEAPTNTQMDRRTHGHTAICFALYTVAWCDVVGRIFWGPF
jgi:hypothetical protein